MKLRRAKETVPFFGPPGRSKIYTRYVITEKVAERCVLLLGKQIFPIRIMQKVLKSIQIWQSYSQIETACFYGPEANCSFCCLYSSKVRAHLWRCGHSTMVACIYFILFYFIYLFINPHQRSENKSIYHKQFSSVDLSKTIQTIKIG